MAYIKCEISKKETLPNSFTASATANLSAYREYGGGNSPIIAQTTMSGSGSGTVKIGDSTYKYSFSIPNAFLESRSGKTDARVSGSYGIKVTFTKI